MATLLNPQNIEETLARTTTAKVAEELQELLGQKTAAYLAGLKDAKMVGRWSREQAKPTDAAERRLRTALHVTQLLTQAYDVDTAKAWLWGSNSRLEHTAPAYAIRHAADADALQPVVPAAIAFVFDAG